MIKIAPAHKGQYSLYAYASGRDSRINPFVRGL